MDTLRREAAALITAALFTDDDSDREGPGVIEAVARPAYETMPRHTKNPQISTVETLRFH